MSEEIETRERIKAKIFDLIRSFDRMDEREAPIKAQAIIAYQLMRIADVLENLDLFMPKKVSDALDDYLGRGH
jgi:hypothetical protein